jgi:formylglycine-generating enzyme required for sulfatase activity
VWEKEILNSIGMKLVRIPPGTFLMGSPENEKDREPFDKDAETQHEVQITRPFWLGVHEVTQEQFKEIMGYNPSYFSSDGEGKPGVKYPAEPGGGKARAPEDTSAFPVENVSWQEARDFCARLSNRWEEQRQGRKYRLPTEAEWEYACRGGSPSYRVFHFGNSLSSKQAAFNGKHPYGGADKGEYLARTCKVGSYKENGFGLYDMHGNVWEWCNDWYDDRYYAHSPRRDPTGPSRGLLRVVRGGTWYFNGHICRSACRFFAAPASRDFSLGFRVALVPLASR